MNKLTRRVLGGATVLTLGVGSFLGGEYVANKRAEREMITFDRMVEIRNSEYREGRANGFIEGYQSALDGDERGRQTYEAHLATLVPVERWNPIPSTTLPSTR